MIYLIIQPQPCPIQRHLEPIRKCPRKFLGIHPVTQLGTSATRILEASRKQVAELIGKSADEIFFTSGGTEGDNWVIKRCSF